MTEKTKRIIGVIVAVPTGLLCGGIAGRLVSGEWTVSSFIVGGVAGLIASIGAMQRAKK